MRLSEDIPWAMTAFKATSDGLPLLLVAQGSWGAGILSSFYELGTGKWAGFCWGLMHDMPLAQTALITH